MKTIRNLYDSGVEVKDAPDWHRPAEGWLVQVDDKLASPVIMIRKYKYDTSLFIVKTVFGDFRLHGNSEVYRKEDLEWME